MTVELRLVGSSVPFGRYAYRGVAGEVVRLYGPHTEADPRGVLLSFLTMFGSAVGSGPYLRRSGDRHPPRLHVVLVGRSAFARKGGTVKPGREIMYHADQSWETQRVVGGLASAEGLMAGLADSNDHRAMLYEPEFARILTVAQRQGSTVSQIIRQAWDGGKLEHRTKKDSIVVDGASVSMLGHITEAELELSLTDTEALNGFANRILWGSVGQSKRLAHDSWPDEYEVKALGKRVGRLLLEARKRTRVDQSPEAASLWERIYHNVEEDHPNKLVETVAARMPAQLLRLSLVYALLDGSHTVDVPHILAACEVWDWVGETIDDVFGQASPTGNRLADSILETLRIAPDKRISRLDIHNATSRNRSREEIDLALSVLERLQYVRSESVPTEGRPRQDVVLVADGRRRSIPLSPFGHGFLVVAELWKQGQHEENEQNEERGPDGA